MSASLTLISTTPSRASLSFISLHFFLYVEFQTLLLLHFLSLLHITSIPLSLCPYLLTYIYTSSDTACYTRTMERVCVLNTMGMGTSTVPQFHHCETLNTIYFAIKFDKFEVTSIIFISAHNYNVNI